MLSGADGLSKALLNHQTGGLRASAFYMGRFTVDVPLVMSGSIQFSASSEIQARADVTAGGDGRSLVPRAKDHPLAPYGQELAIWRTVSAGGRSWEIPLGRYRITDVPESQEFLRGDAVTGWTASLTVQDRFEQIQADDFLAAESPKPGNSVWSEIRRLSPIPVQQSLPDKPVPPATVYDSRLGALTALCKLLGGMPHLTRDGVFTARRRDAWLTSTVPQFDINGVISWREAMSNDFYNAVQVSSSNSNELVAWSEITDMSNPLAVGRAGRRTFKHSSPIYETAGAVQAAAVTMVARLSTVRSRMVDVVCGPEALLLELGDFGWIRDPVSKREALGEVASMSIPLDPTEGVQVSLIVAEER